MRTHLLLIGVFVFVTTHCSSQSAEPPAPAVELTAPERSQFKLMAAQLNRVKKVMEGELAGEDVRDVLEKAREARAVAVFTNPKDGFAKERDRFVSSEIARLQARLEFIKAQKKLAEVDPKADKARRDTLASTQEIQQYDVAIKELVGVVREREKAIEKAKDGGKDIRTELEKSLDPISAILESNPEYKAARKQLKEAEDVDRGADLHPTEPSVVYRAALLRYELQRRKIWP